MRPAVEPGLAAFLVLLVCAEKAAADDSVQDVCRFEPRDFDLPTKMICDSDADKIAIKRNSIRHSVQEISISDVKHVDVERDSLSGLVNLQRIRLMNMELLAIRKNDLAAKGALLINIERVSAVHLNSGAFSVWQNCGSRILIRKIGALHIFDQALAGNGSIETVSIEDVGRVVVNQGQVPFKATIQDMTLRAVSMQYCWEDTFGRNIRNLRFTAVMVNFTRQRCIQAADHWNSLVIRDSYLGDVSTSGISGTITDVLIERTSMNYVLEEGFSLVVARFAMQNCRISQLLGGSLNVKAETSISLHSLEVNDLRRNAFIGLQGQDFGAKMLGDKTVSARDKPQICISYLRVNVWEKESMAFTKGVSITVFHVKCRDQKTKTGSTSEGRGNQNEASTSCIGLMGTTLATMEEFQSRCCSDDISNSPACHITSMWPVYAVSAGIFVLLITLCVIMGVRRLRATRNRDKDVGKGTAEDPTLLTGARSAGGVDRHGIQSYIAQERVDEVLEFQEVGHSQTLQGPPKPPRMSIDAGYERVHHVHSYVEVNEGDLAPMEAPETPLFGEELIYDDVYAHRLGYRGKHLPVAEQQTKAAGHPTEEIITNELYVPDVT